MTPKSLLRHKQAEIREHGQPTEKDEHSADGAERGRARLEREHAAPETRDDRRDLELTVGDRAVLKQLSGSVGRDHEQAGFVEQDNEKQRQQADGREKERDGDGLVIAPVEVTRGGIETGKRQAEHQ